MISLIHTIIQPINIGHSLERIITTSETKCGTKPLEDSHGCKEIILASMPPTFLPFDESSLQAWQASLVGWHPAILESELLAAELGKLATSNPGIVGNYCRNQIRTPTLTCCLCLGNFPNFKVSMFKLAISLFQFSNFQIS